MAEALIIGASIVVAALILAPNRPASRGGYRPRQGRPMAPPPMPPGTPPPPRPSR